MNILFNEQQEILKALIDHKVEFILVGGYAVIFYGHNRVTGDLDIWLSPSNENKLLFISALKDIGFEEESLGLIEHRDFTKAQLFYFGLPPERTDFMTHISGIQFPEAQSLAVTSSIDAMEIKVIHINHLIQNKKASGRLKDLSDVEQLELIIKYNK